MQKNITINLKRLGKKKIYKQPYIINEAIYTLKDLIRVCVITEVERFNEKTENKSLLQFLTPTDIQQQQQQLEKGKIGFGELHNTQKAEVEESLENAFLAHKDGLFVVFIDDEEVEDLDQDILVTKHTNITFIRLTFLTGTYW